MRRQVHTLIALKRYDEASDLKDAADAREKEERAEMELEIEDIQQK